MRGRSFVLVFVLLACGFGGTALFCQQSQLHVLAFYSANTELDHVHFAQDAVKFLSVLAEKEHFSFESTTKWEDLNEDRLKTCQLVIWLNESPSDAEERHAFEHYIEGGGAWLGFHAAGYNDKDTNWPWYVDFLGGAVFHINSWPPLPARLLLADPTHPVAAGLPADFESPSNEWYVWKPSPRLNKDVRVLATFDPANYPLGFKDILESGDLPIVWTNTKYKMLYMNMGHGDKIFTSPTQNRLIENAVHWLLKGAPAPSSPQANGIRISPNAVALNPRTDKFYAVSVHKGAVVVLDGEGRSLSQVEVGAEPVAIAVNPEKNRIYVANGESGTMSVIDGATDKVIATVTVGDLPYAIAVNPASNKIYISKTFSNVLTVVDGETNVASFLKIGIQADAMAVDPVSSKLYLTSYQDPEISSLDGANNQISKIAAQNHLWEIASSPGRKIYAVSAGSANATIVDSKTHSTRLVALGEIPCAIALDTNTGKTFVANYGSSNVTVIDGASDSVAATVNVASHPQAIAADSGNHTVYVISTHANSTTVIDGTTNSVRATLETGGFPYAIAVDSKTHDAVVLSLDGRLTVIDGVTLRASSPTIPENEP